MSRALYPATTLRHCDRQTKLTLQRVKLKSLANPLSCQSNVFTQCIAQYRLHTASCRTVRGFLYFCNSTFLAYWGAELTLHVVIASTLYTFASTAFYFLYLKVSF